MATSTFYPSLDGTAYHSESGLTWTQIVQAAGNSAAHGTDYDQMVDIWADVVPDTDRFRLNARGILLFDTSPIDPGDIILSALLRLYGLYKLDDLACTPDLAIYSSNPASDSTLVGTDYATLGNTPFSNAYPWASWVINGWNEIALITAGLAAINKSGLTKLGIRNANYDVAEELDPGNHKPNWISGEDSYFYPYMVDKGAPYRPELVVTHEAPAAGGGSQASQLLQESLI